MARSLFVFVLTLIGIGHARGQAVNVTMRLDTNRIAVGAATTLHIYAQVAPAYRANADRIFSWSVDVQNTNGAASSANYDAMLKAASDRDSLTSSNGVSVGANRRDIYDTFLNLPGAGVSAPVELMSIPVTGLAAGRSRFQVRAGSNPSLSDFLVSLSGFSDFVTGGDYSAAVADLQVIETGCAIQLRIAPVGASAGPGQRLALTFVPCPGFNHTVQFRAALDDAIGWRPLPGAPHNSGTAFVTNTAALQFFRVATSPGSALGNLALHIASIGSGQGAGQQLALTFTTTPGYDFAIEWQDALVPGGLWQTLAGAPHNSGNVTVTNSSPTRFYRLRASPQ